MKIKLHIVPNSAETQITGLYGDLLKIKVKAAPVDGNANAALIVFFADLLSISRQDIKILQGIRGRKKLIEINLTAEQESNFRRKYLC